MPNNFPEIKVDEKRSDTVFLLEDESILLLEYESNNRINENMYKYIDYILRIGSKYYTEDKVVRNIKIVVIYSSNIVNAPRQFNTGSLVLDTYPVFMKRYEKDKIYKELKEKIKTGRQLTHKDMMNFVLLPYMKTEYNKDIQELIKEDIELAKEIKEEKTQVFVIAGLLTAVNKYIDENYSEEVRKWLSMTAIERIYQKEKEDAVKAVEKEKEVLEKKTEELKKLENELKKEKEQALEAIKEMIIYNLEAKYDKIEISMIKSIKAIEDLETLKYVNKIAVKSSKLSEVDEYLKSLTK